jgi:hypothetical protein
MSKLNITYYKELGEIQVTTENVASNYCNLTFSVTDRTNYGDKKTEEDANHEIDLEGFLVTITEKNNEFLPISFPEAGVDLKSTDQFFLFTERIYWNADDVFNFKVKIGKLEKEFTYTVPRPEQPYPSWTWSNCQWNAPVSYPEGEGLYDWNEENLNWKLI